MRILSVLASPAAGGAEILVRNMTREMVRQGHDCHIVFMSSAAGVGNPADFEVELLATLDAGGVTYEVMAPRDFRNPLAGATRLRRSVRQFGADILHIHLARGLLCRAFSGLRVPTVYTHHNVTANFPPILFKLFDRFVDAYVAIGDACRDFLKAHVRGPMTMIRNGVPADFEASPRDRGPAVNPFILSVGNLTPKKDYGNLIEAAAIATGLFESAGRQPRFAVAGEGEERARLKTLIAERRLDSRFELLGARGDIAELMSAADLLVNSSEHEGLPITLIEAAMSGVPIVATDVGGNGEVVGDGINGFLVPPSDPEALARRIVDALTEDEQYERFSAAAVERSRAFTMEACASAHLSLYSDIVARR
ncbi:glycosyltransferase [Sphingosinicella terrae]|uniref:glycosyltransferase n=1 Tax=Sphingosinicella terrae TaxID=2172047 RepID=UPI000E0D20F9|nr:glycosyltransferase [Sphingosinicella terrae]